MIQGAKKLFIADIPAIQETAGQVADLCPAPDEKVPPPTQSGSGSG